MDRWVWGLRRQVSLLRANGHPEAPHYPVHRVWEEAALVVAHLNQQAVTGAVLTQAAVAGLFSKDAGREFQKLIKSLI